MKILTWLFVCVLSTKRVYLLKGKFRKIIGFFGKFYTNGYTK
ncbi:MAG: hypothetical protein RSC49_00460 [Clostridium sp.]